MHPVPVQNIPSQSKIIKAFADSGPYSDLHIYTPRGAGPFPFVFGIHGGGWRSGSQESYNWLWPKLEPLGCSLVLASYRLAPAHPFPCAYNDLLRSLHWLRDHGTEHSLDIERCLLFGGSAGGHLAMLLATRGTAEGAPMPGIRGAADFCGIMDVTAQFDWDTGRSSPMTQDFLQSTPEKDPALFHQASPIDHIHPAVPPLWICHGSSDACVPPDQSRGFVQRLRSKGHDPIYLEARDVGHAMTEPSTDGDSGTPPEILFEHDFLRFLSRCLLC